MVMQCLRSKRDSKIVNYGSARCYIVKRIEKHEAGLPSSVRGQWNARPGECYQDDGSAQLGVQAASAGSQSRSGAVSQYDDSVVWNVHFPMRVFNAGDDIFHTLLGRCRYSSIVYGHNTHPTLEKELDVFFPYGKLHRFNAAVNPHYGCWQGHVN